MTHCSPTPDLPPPDIPPLPERSTLHLSLRTAAVLLAYVIAFTTLMSATYTSTLGPISASAQKEKLLLIGEVLPPTTYDNTLLEDWIEIPPSKELGLSEATRMHRARREGKAVALVMEAAAPDGYSGRIGLLLAINVSGELLAVRVTEHRETPGLGDYIVPKKDKDKVRPWITQFNGLGLQTVTPEQWRVKKDGGRFEQRAGATISARAVTNATRRALVWATANTDRLFALATGKRFE